MLHQLRLAIFWVTSFLLPYHVRLSIAKSMTDEFLFEHFMRQPTATRTQLRQELVADPQLAVVLKENSHKLWSPIFQAMRLREDDSAALAKAANDRLLLALEADGEIALITR